MDESFNLQIYAVFEWRGSDGKEWSPTTTVTFTVAKVNDAPVTGGPGGALLFDGDNDFVIIKTKKFPRTDFTIQFWMRLNRCVPLHRHAGEFLLSHTVLERRHDAGQVIMSFGGNPDEQADPFAAGNEELGCDGHDLMIYDPTNLTLSMYASC